MRTWPRVRQFGANLRDESLARVDLGRDRLQFEGKRHLPDREERSRERDEGREERIEDQKLELDHFRLMMADYCLFFE